MKHVMFMLLMLFALVACGAEDAAPEPDTNIKPTIAAEQTADLDGTIAEVRWNGGMCLNQDGSRVCETIMLIDASGTYTLTGNIPEPKVQTMEPAQLETLTSELTSTDFDTILATPFTDTCPRAFDGQAPTYTFYTAQEEVHIDSCEVAVDMQDPLFATIDQLYQAAWN